MRVLFVLHDFLPAHPAGTEVYTGDLALRLARRGHEVRLFATEKDIGRPHLALERREWRGLVVHELVNNLFYEDFAQTWDYPPAAAALGRVLDEFRPDVVGATSVLPQSLHVLRSADLSGVSVAMYGMLVVTCLLWGTYGIVIGDLLVTAPNVFVLPCAALIAVKAWRSQQAAPVAADALVVAG